MGHNDSPKRPVIPGMHTTSAAKRGRPKKQLLTIIELAAYLNVSRTTIYGLLDRGLPSYRVAVRSTGGIRFDLVRVLDWLEAEREQRRSEGWE